MARKKGNVYESSEHFALPVSSFAAEDARAEEYACGIIGGPMIPGKHSVKVNDYEGWYGDCERRTFALTSPLDADAVAVLTRHGIEVSPQRIRIPACATVIRCPTGISEHFVIRLEDNYRLEAHGTPANPDIFSILYDSDTHGPEQ